MKVIMCHMRIWRAAQTLYCRLSEVTIHRTHYKCVTIYIWTTIQVKNECGNIMFLAYDAINEDREARDFEMLSSWFFPIKTALPTLGVFPNWAKTIDILSSFFPDPILSTSSISLHLWCQERTLLSLSTQCSTHHNTPSFCQVLIPSAGTLQHSHRTMATPNAVVVKPQHKRCFNAVLYKQRNEQPSAPTFWYNKTTISFSVISAGSRKMTPPPPIIQASFHGGTR